MILPKVRPTNQDVARHYDDLDVFYREIWGEHVHHGLWLTGNESPETAARQLVDRVVAAAKIRPGYQVCDVGCGYGTTARILAAEQGVRVTGLTLSSAQHAFATAQHPGTDNPTYLQGDWLENGLPASSFDTVLAIESLAHMADKTRFFTEAYRVLKPGGRLVICAWMAEENPRPWEIRHLLEPICREGRLPSLGTAEEYNTLLDDAGFIDPDHEDLSKQVYRTWPICFRRLLWGLLTRPRYLRFLFDAHQHDRIFALTLPRLMLAFRTGCFRYGLFTAVKQPAPHLMRG